MSNYAAPPQLVESVPYHDLQAMHAFARRWRDEHRGKWFTAPKLSGFCLLMKRAVYEKIGGLDERFGIGFFDDEIWPSGRGGPGLSWRWRMICLFIISAAGRFRATGSMPRSCWMRMPGGSRTKWGLERTNGKRGRRCGPGRRSSRSAARIRPRG